MFLKALALLFLIVGAVVTFGAKAIVEKYQLDKDVKINFDNELTEEEILKYKNQQAILKIKMIGMFICLPGVVLVLLLFK